MSEDAKEVLEYKRERLAQTGKYPTTAIMDYALGSGKIKKARKELRELGLWETLKDTGLKS